MAVVLRPGVFSHACSAVPLLIALLLRLASPMCLPIVAATCDWWLFQARTTSFNGPPALVGHLAFCDQELTHLGRVIQGVGSMLFSPCTARHRTAQCGFGAVWLRHGVA